MKLVQQLDSMDCGASHLTLHCFADINDKIFCKCRPHRHEPLSCPGSHSCRNLINLAAEQIYLVYETPESPAMFDNIPRSQ